MTIISPSPTAPLPTVPPSRGSAGEQLLALGWNINATQYRAVHLAAQYDDELEWFRQGLKSASHGIARDLQLHGSTAREWIRVGHSLRYLPLIDAAFAANEISYAKVRILTRWADHDNDNEQQLLDLAHEHTANRLTTAIAKVLDDNSPESDDAKDQRHHDARSFTSYTDGDGMAVIRIVVPPVMAKPVTAAVDELVRRIASTPVTTPTQSEAPDASADASDQHRVVDDTDSATQSGQNASADAPLRPSRTTDPLPQTLAELRQRWQPQPDDDWYIPSLAQQRCDAFVALFLGINIDLTTEVVIHVRGNGNTLDDGTPISNNAVARQLDHSFIRALIHDAHGNPIDATNRRRHPTTRQARLVSEQHSHQCVDCGSTDLLEYDHNPPHEQTGHTVTTELELRCAPCHRARHRQARIDQPDTHHLAA